MTAWRKIIFVFNGLFFLLFLGCKGSVDNVQQPLGIEDKGVVTVLGSQENQDYFSITIPQRMRTMEELNSDALLQFGYVEEVNSPTDPTFFYEHFLVVLMETKAEIAGYSVELHPELLSYHDHALELLRADREEFKVVEKEREAQQLNNLRVVQSEAICPNYNETDTGHYFLAVFEGEKAFYQVLTWCPESQVAVFAPEINQFIRSFKEL